MHPGTLIIEINVVQYDISDNFYFNHKAVESNLTELFFLNLMNILKTFFPDFPQELNFNFLTHVITHLYKHIGE